MWRLKALESGIVARRYIGLCLTRGFFPKCLNAYSSFMMMTHWLANVSLNGKWGSPLDRSLSLKRTTTSLCQSSNLWLLELRKMQQTLTDQSRFSFYIFLCKKVSWPTCRLDAFLFFFFLHFQIATCRPAHSSMHATLPHWYLRCENSVSFNSAK